MLNRFKGLIDGQIAPDQTRSRPSSSTTRSLSRSSSRTARAAAAKAASAPGSTPDKEKEKDPSEFENDTSDASGAVTPARTGTPANAEGVTEDDPLGALGTDTAEGLKNGAKENGDAKPTVAEEKNGDGKKSPAPSTTAQLAQNADLPTDVRVKLRKLDKIEQKHTGRHASFS